MYRNLVTSLLDHERVRTTDAKAKGVRSLAEKMITLGKRGDLHARRRALRVIRSRTVTAKLFEFGAPFPGDDGYRVSAPVGSFRPNPFGLFDMHGNVAEWTADVWQEHVLGPLTDPLHPHQRVVKGGDFTCGPNGEAYFGCTCGSRSWNYLGNANFGTGFRVVIELDQVGSM